MDNETKFIQFLIQAKRSTYAANGKLSPSSRPASKDLAFQMGDYLYIDTYLGSVDFIGEEAVWYGQTPIWAMNYYGIMLVEETPAGFSPCLKGALQRVPVEAPYRGPAFFQHNHLEYRCHWSGTVDQFEGTEQIGGGDQVIYRLVFHGGGLR
jgi:hypothetical protein